MALYLRTAASQIGSHVLDLNFRSYIAIFEYIVWSVYKVTVCTILRVRVLFSCGQNLAIYAIFDVDVFLKQSQSKQFNCL